MLQKIKEKMMPILIVGFLVGGLYVMITQNNGDNSGGNTALANVIVPDLSPIAKQGEALYNANCAACHGVNVVGSESGPPLIHTTYNPGHHADEAFFRAAKNGVQAHHWGFGNMPVIAGVSDEDITKIVRYIRDMQFANGIITQPHLMQ